MKIQNNNDKYNLPYDKSDKIVEYQKVKGEQDHDLFEIDTDNKNFIKKIKRTNSQNNKSKQPFQMAKTQYIREKQRQQNKLPRVIFDMIGSKTRQMTYQNKLKNQNLFNSQIKKSDRKNLSQGKQSFNSVLSDEWKIKNRQKNNQSLDSSIQQQGRINQTSKTHKKAKFKDKLLALSSLGHQNKKYLCPICQIQGTKRQFLSINDDQCVHIFCRSCLHQYAIYKIKRFQTVLCPQQNCKVKLHSKSKLYSQLPLDTRQKFKKLEQYVKSLESKNSRLCPNQICSGVLQIGDPQKNPRCPQCKIFFCRKCYFKNHAGACDPHQLRFFQQTLNYRQCSQCKNIIQKIQGCNHMTCRCGYQFCYLCGAKWSRNHLCPNLRQQGQYFALQNGCDCFQCCDIDFCCQCMCFDTWQICQIAPIRIIAKVLLIVLSLSIIVPLWILYVILNILAFFLFSILTGLFILPCQILQQPPNALWILLSIVFLPITIIILIGLGIRQNFLEQDMTIFDTDIISIPCQIFTEIIEL